MPAIVQGRDQPCRTRAHRVVAGLRQHTVEREDVRQGPGQFHPMIRFEENPARCPRPAISVTSASSKASVPSAQPRQRFESRRPTAIGPLRRRHAKARMTQVKGSSAPSSDGSGNDPVARGVVLLAVQGLRTAAACRVDHEAQGERGCDQQAAGPRMSSVTETPSGWSSEACAGTRCVLRRFRRWP